MKRKLALSLVGVLLVGCLSGCGSNKVETENGNVESQQTEETVSTDEMIESQESETEVSNSDVAEVVSDATTIQIDGVSYHFPMTVQELVDNGWTMNGKFPFPARPGSNALVDFTKGDLKLSTNVTSITGAEVPMEEGAISYLSFSAEHNNTISVVFPGNISIGMSKEEVESALSTEFVYDASKKYFEYEKQEDMGKLEIQILLTDDESQVKEISYTFWS